MTTKTISLRRYSYRPDSTIEVDLIPNEHSDKHWDVRYDGTIIGEVSRYTGSLDRPLHRGSRIRHQGKTRTLWSFGRKGGRPMFGQVSRAEAIRTLIGDHEHDLAQAPKEGRS